ncbi:MAG: glycosyltransferase family 2 protein [Ignavibacteriaceae bacterium]|nr:glycosyltransferase family 2 protein [Ignavibacteriaceae bacterium]GIK23331.1 MAG: glycosyl transferase family A [Ignavibacteriota bacterium]
MSTEQNLNTMKYVLITAAHNEQEFIEKTIHSVINQLHKPLEWIIVSDGSTDNTESIVRKYSTENSCIKLLTNNRKEGRDFASKVYAINLGLKNIQAVQYDYIGILDADVSFEGNYYSSLIEEFRKNPKLGIVGGNYFDIINGKKVRVQMNPFSVRGATQFFQRKCFEQIGGLIPMKYGGEDAAACFSARMYGWETKSIPGLIALHHRLTGDKNLFKARLRDGYVEHNLGYHPLFQLVKCIQRFKQKPYLIGSVLRFIGFWIAGIKFNNQNLSKELRNYIKKEQLGRLFHFI